MNNIWLIIEREYLTRVKKKSFVLLTVLGPVLLAAGLSLVVWLSLSENIDHQVLVVDGQAPAFKPLKNTANIKFTYGQDMDLVAAKEIFYTSNYTCILYLPDNVETGERSILYYKKQPSMSVIRVIEDQVESIVEELKLAQYNISKEQFNNVKTNYVLNAVKYSESGEEETLDKGKTLVGFGLGAAIYMFIFLYGVQVMRGVIEEKTNRIVEVIITSVKPVQLMLGKIIGVGLVSLTQFGLWILLTMGIFTAVQSTVFKEYASPEKIAQVQATPEVMEEMKADQAAPGALIDPNNIIYRTNWPLMITLFLFYFFGGYFLYSALFAAVGAAVDSETDTQQFMMPITMPLFLAYILSVTIVVQDPEGPVSFWLSMIPLTSPIIMLVRVALGVGEGGIPLWEVLLSMALLVVGFAATVWMAGRIYRTGILMYGKKASYRELWKWITYKQ